MNTKDLKWETINFKQRENLYEQEIQGIKDLLKLVKLLREKGFLVEP